MKLKIENFARRRNRQTGGLTVFTAIMVLIILTMMIFYAARVGLFTQRVSANEVRQKVAFNAAEAALDWGAEYLLANSQLMLSRQADATGGTRDGWFTPGKEKWVQCTAIASVPSDPCWGMKPKSFTYDDVSTTTGVDSLLPTGAIPDEFPDEVIMRLSANMCFVDLKNPDATDCLPAPGTAADTSSSYMIITLLSYGFSDCENPADVSTCQGRATVAKPIANYKQMAGAPTVPLVSKSTFPPTGTAHVVPNPNGGGVGVPISVWINSNPEGHSCPQEDPDMLSHGSWNTCEMQEWYGLNDVPEGVACTITPCKCTDDESISYANDSLPGNIPKVGIDIVKDFDFPCDLFETFFNTPRDQYELIKMAATEVTDCSQLSSSSSGILWITDTKCSLNKAAGTINAIGSITAPVILISEVEVDVTGNVDIFGVLYIFDGVPDTNANMAGQGGATIYGSLIVDAPIDGFRGNVDVVYAEGVLLEAAGINGFGGVNGGWRDFGLPELAW